LFHPSSSAIEAERSGLLAATATPHAMAMTVYDIDPKGDVFLCFPENAVEQQLGQSARAEPERRHRDRLGPLSQSPSPGPGTMQSFDDLLAARPGGPGPSASRISPPPDTGTLKLRVSSAVLCLVSPVFSALFSSPMAEGEAFRAHDSPRPFDLALPEDNWQAFSILCNVFHHRAKDIPFLPSTTMLLSLAAHVDKYDCGTALMPYGVLWLKRATDPARREDPEYASLTGRCHLLLFAYVLDLPEQFARLSWDVLLMHRQLFKNETESGFELPISPEHELLRHDLHGKVFPPLLFRYFEGVTR